MAVKQRARKDEDKAERRNSILEVAASMLGPSDYHHITMAEVARQAGLAKGTLYLYFDSKEELFLAALEAELAEWFAELEHAIDGPVAIEALATTIARGLTERSRLIDLLALLHNVLEQNVAIETAIAFKRSLLRHLHAAAATIESALPDLPTGASTNLLLRLHALVIGMQHMGNPAKNIAVALEEADLAPLRVDFERDLQAALVDLIYGMTRATRA